MVKFRVLVKVFAGVGVVLAGFHRLTVFAAVLTSKALTGSYNPVYGRLQDTPPPPPPPTLSPQTS